MYKLQSAKVNYMQTHNKFLKKISRFEMKKKKIVELFCYFVQCFELHNFKC